MKIVLFFDLHLMEIFGSRIVNMSGMEEVIFVPIIKFQDSQRFAMMLRLFFF